MDSQSSNTDLLDFIAILWKRKITIVVLTLSCLLLAGILAFVMPSQWEVSTVISPPKFLAQSADGKFEEVVLVEPKQIVGQINEGAYAALVGAELNLQESKVVKIKAENLKDTDLIKISMRDRDVGQTMKILDLVLNLIKSETDKKAEIEIKGIDSEIKTREIEKAATEEEIKIQNRKLFIISQRKKDIEKEMSITRKRIDSLDAEQRTGLKAENRSSAENLGLLLYSNEIQQSLRYHDSLNELLNSKKIEEEDLSLSLATKAQTVKQKENEIVNFKERKGRIDFTEVKKSPASSPGPVFPPKKIIIAAGFLLGLFGSILVAFFMEYLDSAKRAQAPKRTG